MFITEFFEKNGIYFLIISPVIYFIIRDIIGVIREKQRLKEYKKTIADSEKRIYQVMKDSDANKEELLKQLDMLRSSINSANQAISQTKDEQKKET